MRSLLRLSWKWVPLLLALLSLLPPSALAMTASEVYEQVKDSIVVVKTYDLEGNQRAFGSGVILPSGDIVTNLHVVGKGWRYTVGRGNEATPTTLKAGYPDKDICLITNPGLVAKPARLGKTDTLKVGDPVYGVGAPQGLELSLSEGIVSQLRGGHPPIIQTTVAISPGSSGGGLFNAKGELVGITAFYLKDGQNLNFALPVEWIGEISIPKLEPGIPDRADRPKDGSRVLSEIALETLLGKSTQSIEFNKYKSNIDELPKVSFYPYNNNTYYSFKNNGISFLFENNNLTTIFLYSEGHEGFGQYKGSISNGLSFGYDRMTARNKFGLPSESGGGQDAPELFHYQNNKYPLWDKWFFLKYSLHLQYKNNDQILSITLGLLDDNKRK
jgi:hypothetical protein